MLDSNQRSLQEMKEKAEYQSFFARPVITQPTMEQATPTADSASDPAEGKQVEEQQQIPSSDDNKNDNSKSNGKNKGETE